MICNSKAIIMDESFIRRTVNYQMLHASFYYDIGLFNGKMGCDIFLFHAARHVKSSLYEDYAGELFGEIFEDIHEDIPIGLSHGLCGIGWGTEYLARQGFLEGDTNDVLTKIDKKIMQTDPRRIVDYSLETGLEGIVCYVLSRLNSSFASKKPFDEIYIEDLLSSCLNVPIQKGYISILVKYLNGTNYSAQQDIISIISKSNVNKEECLSWKLGLQMLIS